MSAEPDNQHERPHFVTPPSRDHRGLMTLNVLLFFASGVFAIAAVWFAFRAYFALAGTVANPTGSELAAIDVCAAVSVLAALGSVVVAVIIRGRWGVVFGSLSGAALVGAVIVAALLTGPQGILRPTPAPQPDLPSSYQPCYSGSTTCN
ncbi:hypothetical protein [Subtercola endophyticus]|uniref:hypothetical protein n=1 Tax=Subtercola endophyticus TaxID=2895559 RepID=UPI001E54F506|nr:hypothetical protein [Subtercola endophyticus]UFS59668.1 hypothetical protein LQ955_02390 [Subtercola endophyticus]